MYKPSWKALLFLSGIFLFIAINWADSYFHGTYMPRLKAQIEATLSEKFKARAYIKNLDANFSWPRIFPMTVIMQELHVERDFEFTIKIAKATAEVKPGGPLLRMKDFYPDIKIDLSDVDLRYDIHDSKTAATPTPPQQTGALPQNLRELNPSAQYLSDVSISLNIQNLRTSLTKNRQPYMQFNQVHVLTQMTSLDQPIFLTLSTQFLASNPIAPFWIPVSIQSQLSLKNSALQVSSTDIKVLGFTSRTQGEINFSNDKISLESHIVAKDLSQIPLNLKDFPIRKWSGAAIFDFKVTGTKTNPQIDGALSLTRAQMQLDLAQPQIKARGQAAGDLGLRFFWNGSLHVPLIQWDVDLQQLDLQYSDLFHKPGQYPLKSSGKMTWDKDLNLENVKTQLGALELSAQGVYRADGDSDLSFHIPITDLNGMEKLILPLSRFPLQGRLGLQATLKGPLHKKDLIRVDVGQLKVENFSSTVAYRNPDISVDGPVKLDMNVHLLLQGADVRSGSFDLNGDFSALQFQYKNLFRKNRGDLAKLNIQAAKQGNKIQLRNSQLQTPAGAIEFSGEPPLHPAAGFHMVIETKSLDLQKIAQWLPEYKKLMPQALLQSRLDFAGSLDSADFLNSPLKTSGSIGLKISKLVLPPLAPAVQADPSKPQPSEPASALLQDKALFRGMNIRTKLELGEFSMLPYEAQGISLDLVLQNLKLAGSGQVQKVFGGKIGIRNFSVPLNQVEPRVSFSLNADGIRIEKVTAAAMPQFEKLMQAQAKCEVTGESPWPTSKVFLPGIAASGKMQLSNGTLSTVELANMMKDLFAKIPQAKPEMLSQRGPLQITEGLAEFRMQGGQISMKPFFAKTARKDEVNLTGTLDLMMNLNMQGSLALADGVQNLGSIYEANKDAQGRLVIPLEIKGNALKPEMKMAQDVLAKMLGRTLEYEKNKAVNSAKQQVSTELTKKKNELGQKLGDELKKKVQGLFN